MDGRGNFEIFSEFTGPLERSKAKERNIVKKTRERGWGEKRKNAPKRNGRRRLFPMTRE